MSHIDEGRLAAYLDGELPAGSGELVEIELHVEACADCRKLLEESLKHRNRARAILRSGAPSVMEAPAFEDILRRAGKSASARGVAQQRSRLASLAWAATIVLAVGAGWYVARDRGTGPLADALRSMRTPRESSNETPRVLAEKTESNQAADARREEQAAPAAPVPSPQAGARADEPKPAAAPQKVNQPPAAIALDERAKLRDTTAPARLAEPPVAAGEALASGAARTPPDSAANQMAKSSAPLDASAVTGQVTAERKRAESVLALKDTPSAARRSAQAPAAAPAPAAQAALPAPAPVWRETSQGSAMRQLGRLPLQVADLPVLGYYVRSSGAQEVRVTHDLGQGQVLEVIQTRLTTDSTAIPQSRNEVAGFAGSEVTEEAEGYRTTVRGPVSRDSLSVLLRKLR